MNDFPYIHDAEIKSIVFNNFAVKFEIDSTDGYIVDIEVYNIIESYTSPIGIQNIILDIVLKKVNSSNAEQIISEFDFNFESRNRRENESTFFCDKNAYYLCIEPSAGFLAMIIARKVVIKWLDKCLVYEKDTPVDMDGTMTSIPRY